MNPEQKWNYDTDIFFDIGTVEICGNLFRIFELSLISRIL